MGNFGKRILIVLLSVVAVVAIALIGNAYQQSERIHKVSSSKDEVYSGSYDGVSYKLTKEDLWEAILSSNAMDTVTEMLNVYLLQSVIDGISDTDERIAKKIEFLTYGTSDEDKIADLKANDETDKQLKENFENKLAVLGYEDKEYAKLMIAYDEYAKYRLDNNLSVSDKTYDFSSDAITKELEKGYDDVEALVIKFYSKEDATSFMKNFVNCETGLVEVSSAIRYYFGDSKYRPLADEQGNYEVAWDETNGYTFEELTQEVTYKDETTGTEKVPYANVEVKTIDGKKVYTWDNEYNAWVNNNSATSNGTTDHYIYRWNETDENWEYYKVWTETTKKDAEGNVVKDEDGNEVKERTLVEEANYNYIDDTLRKSYDDQTSFTTANTIALTDDQYFALLVKAYNDFYKYQKDAIDTNVTVSSITSKFENEDKLKEALKKEGFAYINGEIRKYVGNMEYVVDVEKSVNGKIVYKQATDEDGVTYDIPNYKIEKDADGNPILDSNSKFIFILDEMGERIPNDTKKDINDVETLDATNTIAISNQQLYGLYAKYGTDSDQLTYNYASLKETSSELATEIFETLKINGTFYTTSVTSFDSNYYLIVKLTNEVVSEVTEEKIAEYKENQYKTYLEDESFVNACLAELRKEAGLTIYDKFLTQDYKTGITYNSTSNKYGATSANIESYYKTKSYKANKIASIKAVDVMGTKVAKKTISADDLYEYAMKYGASSYLASAAMGKILLNMPEFKEIHEGTPTTNYLTSKNWKMQEYAAQTQYLNYNFEYYKQMYAQYGLSYQYSSISEFLYTYGARSYDDLVENLMKGTMKNVFLYKFLVGNMKDELTSSFEFSAAVKDLTVNSDKFKALTEDYIDLNVNHLLVYVDLDEDGTPDAYDDFMKAFEDGTQTLKNTSKADFEAVLDRFYDALIKYVYSEDVTFSATSSSALSDFVTKYNDSSREFKDGKFEGEYAEFKQYGIHVKYETLGDVTSTTIKSYVKPFQEAIKVLNAKLAKADKDLLGYSLSDGLCETEFGLHFIYATPCDSFEIPSFKFENEDYVQAMTNANDAISDSQIAVYMLEKYYSNIYGNTDNPASRAGFAYPNLPAEITEKISTVYGSFLDLVMDTNTSYFSSLIVINNMINETASDELKASLTKLKDVYVSAIYED